MAHGKGKDKHEHTPHHSRHHGSSSKKHQNPSEDTGKHFPCKSKHRECKKALPYQYNMKTRDGNLEKITWAPCRLEDVRNYFKKYEAPRDQGETEGGAENSPQSRHAEQPREPQEAAAGPADQPVPRPAYEWMPEDDDMVYDVAPGSQHQGTGYTQGMAFPDEPYAGGYEGDPGEGMASAAGSGGKQGGGSWPGSTVGPLVKPPRAQWVAHRPENLYHGYETDGVAKSQPHHLIQTTWDWGDMEYSMDYSKS